MFGLQSLVALLILSATFLVLDFADALASFSSFSSFQFAPNGVCILPHLFVDLDTKQSFTMRNVPGEGDCMFLAVALATLTSMGLGGNDALLRAISRETRAVVAQVLESPGNLVIEGKRMVSTDKLLLTAATQEGLTKIQYLDLLRNEGIEGGLYGGGPELTVLANVLRRPISIYELADDNSPNTNSESTQNVQLIHCKGVFGEETFRDPLKAIPDAAVLSVSQPGAYSWHLHILVVDVTPEEKHACVLLPQ